MPDRPVRPPPLPFCHMCGRQFGTSSLAIHQKTCRERFERENGKSAPAAPLQMPIGAKLNSRQWDAYNAAANSTFTEEALYPCPNCGRTFLKDRLEVHLRSCGKGHFVSPESAVLGKSHLGASARGESPSARTGRPEPSERKKHNELLPCPHCTRTFLPESLEIHLKSCRPATARPPPPSPSRPPAAAHGPPAGAGASTSPKGSTVYTWAPSAAGSSLDHRDHERMRGLSLGAAAGGGSSAAAPPSPGGPQLSHSAHADLVRRMPHSRAAAARSPSHSASRGSAAPAPPPASPAKTTRERLLELSGLLEDGLISAEEHATQRKNILASI